MFKHIHLALLIGCLQHQYFSDALLLTSQLKMTFFSSYLDMFLLLTLFFFLIELQSSQQPEEFAITSI